MKVSEWAKTKMKPPHILIYGAAGSGKTALVAQAPNGYLMDFDYGMLTAAKLQDAFTQVRDIEFDTYRDYNLRQPSAWLKAKKKILEIAELAHTYKWEYNTLVIDSLTGMSQACQNQVFFENNLYGKPLGNQGLKLYGFIVAELQRMINVLASLPCRLMVTTHELPLEIGKGADAETFLKPRIVGKKLPAQLPEFFDEVWYARAKSVAMKPSYTVSWRPHAYIETRTRSGKLMEIPHIEIGLKGIFDELGYDY